MSATPDIYKAIINREKLSRQEAERLLEVKSLELYDKTQSAIQSRDELAGVNALLSSVMASSPDSIITVSSDFSIQSISGTAEKRFGFIGGNLKNKSIDVLIPGAVKHLKENFTESFTINDLNGMTKSGDTFPLEIRGAYGEVHKDVNFVLFAHDVTEKREQERQKKLREEQMNETRRLEAIGTLSAGIAHEINTPIQFIGDNISFLAEACTKIKASYNLYDQLAKSVETDPKYQLEYSGVIKFNEKIRLQTLMEDIQDSLFESIDGIAQVRDIVLLMKEFSHPGSPDLELVDINSLITNSIKICRNHSVGVTDITLEIDNKLPKIQCYSGQLRQVVVNLLINAIDAVTEAGKPDPKVHISTACADKFISIEISDTGSGIPNELCQKVFDPFFTTKPVGKGTGQGLSIAKNCIVNIHKGSLKIVNRDGFSTTLRVELPIRTESHFDMAPRENFHAA